MIGLKVFICISLSKRRTISSDINLNLLIELLFNKAWQVIKMCIHQPSWHFFFQDIDVTPWCKIVAPWSAIVMAVVLFAIQCPSLLLGSRHTTAGGMNCGSLYKYIAFNVEIAWLNCTFDINHQSKSIHLISFKWCRWGIFNCYRCTSPAVQSIL